MERPWFGLELWTTFFFAIAIAPIEGGVVSVFAKHAFAESVPDATLNWFVAFLQATGELANILSFVWISSAQGRPKVRFINALQIPVILSVACLAFAPASMAGLWMLTGLVVIARVCWSGILTIRPTVWRANYARQNRARIVGKFQAVQVFVIAMLGMALGAALDHDAKWYGVVTPCCAAMGLGAFFLYGRIRMRRQTKVMREEAGERVMKPWHGPRAVVEVLRNDPMWAKFQVSMFILGLGNLMMNPIIVITLKEQFGMGYLKSILVTSTLQAVIMPFAIPMWARMLDRAHVVKFRAVHSWIFVVATSVFAIGAWQHQAWMFFAGSVMLGIAYGGGQLAWNLGHVDFAPPSETSRYMASHVTLNGVRGLIGPFLSVSLFQGLQTAGFENASAWVLGLCVLVSAAGSMGFVRLKREMGAKMNLARRAG
jgi:hypothetical protein